MTQTITEAKDELDRILGVTDIKTENPRWLALMREGVVVNSTSAARGRKPRSTSKTSACRPTPKTRSGISSPWATNVYCPPTSASGWKPKNPPAASAWNAPPTPPTTARSCRLPASVPGSTKTSEHERGYLAIRDEITERYDDILIELLSAYRGAARAAYRWAMALTL